MEAAFSICVRYIAVALLHAVTQQDLSPTHSTAAALPRMHSLLVSHRGQLTLEYYARGYGGTRLANIKSASKSVIATQVGIAIERRLIAGVDERIAGWFPELRNDSNTRKAAITIEDRGLMRRRIASINDLPIEASRLRLVNAK